MSKTIPQPQETFLIGNLKDVDSEHFLESLQRLQKLYGAIFRINILGQSIIVVSSQELVNFVCDENKFDKKVSIALQELRALIGDGLFSAD
ncbi:unnamed protein product, partial [Adineta steineri]